MSSASAIGDATLRSLAEAHGVCVRPVMWTLTDRLTESTTAVAIPCGSTRESKCPPCAGKAKRLRAHQCSEGWHLTDDPLPDDNAGHQLDEEDVDEEEEPERRTRSTRRRTDATDLPKVRTEHRTTGAAFTSSDGKTYRPSMFVTLTLPLRADRPRPRDPRRPEHVRLPAGGPGRLARQTLKAVTKAYLQLWWPPFDDPVYVDRTPVWDPETERYRDPDTGFALPTWAQALDRLDDDLDADPSQRPAHLMRFGTQVDAQGIIAPSKDADGRSGT